MCENEPLDMTGESQRPSGVQLLAPHAPEVLEWLPPSQSHCTVSPTKMVVTAGLLVPLETSLNMIPAPTLTCLMAALAAVADTHIIADPKSSFLNSRDSKRIENLSWKVRTQKLFRPTKQMIPLENEREMMTQRKFCDVTDL